MQLTDIFLKNYRRCLLPFVLLACLGMLVACGGESGGGENTDQTIDPLQSPWTKTLLHQLEYDGLTAPWADAVIDSADQVHLAFLEGNINNNRISYLKYDPASPAAAANQASEVRALDNNNGIALSVSASDGPVIFYQGEGPLVPDDDAMFSLPGAGNGWDSYTAAIGENPRNPAIFDGLAGDKMAAVVDNLGRQHLVYQFYYEGMDAMNFTYPDMRYVQIDLAAPNATEPEETVEGNVYSNNGGVQNRVGVHAAITFDVNNNPVVFYYAEFNGLKGLRVARRVSGQWELDWVEQDIEIGHISASRSSTGQVAVAYYVETMQDSFGEQAVDLLRFAQENVGTNDWSVQMVDESRRTGEYCNLAFAGESPLIVYREMQTHGDFDLLNLKLATYNGRGWETEIVDLEDGSGYYNNVLVDSQGRIVIISYSETTKSLYQYQKLD